MAKSKGATPGAILSATPGAAPRQRPGNEGAIYTPYTPSVAPALGGRVHAERNGSGSTTARLASDLDAAFLLLVADHPAHGALLAEAFARAFEIADAIVRDRGG